MVWTVCRGHTTQCLFRILTCYLSELYQKWKSRLKANLSWRLIPSRMHQLTKSLCAENPLFHIVNMFICVFMCYTTKKKKKATGKRAFIRTAGCTPRQTSHISSRQIVFLLWSERPVLLYWCVAENELNRSSGCYIVCKTINGGKVVISLPLQYGNSRGRLVDLFMTHFL